MCVCVCVTECNVPDHDVSEICPFSHCVLTFTQHPFNSEANKNQTTTTTKPWAPGFIFKALKNGPVKLFSKTSCCLFAARPDAPADFRNSPELLGRPLTERRPLSCAGPAGGGKAVGRTRNTGAPAGAFQQHWGVGVSDPFTLVHPPRAPAQTRADLLLAARTLLWPSSHPRGRVTRRRPLRLG